MIESAKQMERFINRYEPILKKHGQTTIRMELPTKTGNAFCHRSFSIIRHSKNRFEGSFKSDPSKTYSQNCIEDLLDVMGCISLLENTFEK